MLFPAGPAQGLPGNGDNSTDARVGADRRVGLPQGPPRHRAEDTGQEVTHPLLNENLTSRILDAGGSKTPPVSLVNDYKNIICLTNESGLDSLIYPLSKRNTFLVNE